MTAVQIVSVKHSLSLIASKIMEMSQSSQILILISDQRKATHVCHFHTSTWKSDTVTKVAYSWIAKNDLNQTLNHPSKAKSMN